MKVVIAGGGTGGHLYPGIAVAEKLKPLGIEVLFMVSDRGIERDVLTPLGYNFIEQDISAFKGVGVIKKLNSLKKLAKSADIASKHLMRGDKVLLMGGFAAAPVAMAATFKKVDIHIHEQNSVMGMVNKLMSIQARRIFLSYLETKGAPGRSMFVGNPVRQALMHGTVKDLPERNILVLGGSGGSRKINMQIAQMAEGLLKDGYKIHHQTGRKMYDETVEEYERYIDSTTEGLKIVPYIDDMQSAYHDADLVIARSGSGTVFEVTYARRPAIYIPFAKATDNHQYYNAAAMVKNEYATILEEKKLSAETLSAEINGVFDNMEHYTRRLATVEALDSAELIVKQLLI